MFVKVVWRCVSGITLGGGLSMKYNSHSYSAEVVTALDLFLGVLVWLVLVHVFGLGLFVLVFGFFFLL